ncbi:Na+/melibiose symporter-like transporter [Novosphingobium kunmingense]|uniref:Na+/melibiose symporter-like transporter n=1 Tax=Novosphingobium kunmingense TaxID=1211806 RepID=A0A2N0H6F3_9SPHN|nr:MFS transporter [Novosphingobium kunmingense]PKB14502.1 Na+/melibiose symporter-like transporter [Novosphingobium kunmingense]
MADQPGEARQTARFLYLYALAACGGAIAYVPFLTILLPLRVTALGSAQSLDIVAAIAFCGAVAASLGNIAFGWLSDRTGSRRAWIAAGLVLSSALLVAMPMARDAVTLIALIVVWQLALNMMLGPLSAWAGDLVPDAQKGLLGGLLAFAPAIGALSGSVVTIEGLSGPDGRLVIVAAAVIACVLPVLLLGQPRPMPQLMAPRSSDTPRAAKVVRGMWLARLLVQVSEASLFAFLLLWLRSIDPALHENRAAGIFTAVLSAAVLVALLVGRWSDRHDRPIEPLAAAAAVSALGLAIMALAPSMALALVGYAVFGLASSVFLALHSGQTLRVLPQPQHRGRDMGLFNLTNTTPSLIMPWLTLALVPRYGFDALFVVLTVLAASAALILAAMARR